MGDDGENAAGTLSMMRTTAKELDARAGEVEERVAAPESRAG